MLDHAIPLLSRHVKRRAWIISDLQQPEPERARQCMTTAVADFRSLQMKCDQIWYLGDSVEHANLQHIEQMVEMQQALLSELDTPVRFILGNHDLDYALSPNGGNGRDPLVPFHRMVQGMPGWQTIPRLDDFHFLGEIGDHLVVFLSDHLDLQGRWACSHGAVHGAEPSAYPHGPEAYAALRDRIAASGRPCIIAGHYAFAGGNRPSDILAAMMPLPSNVVVHFHGHAHIGDARWAGKDAYRKIACVDNHPIPQIDVASLENRRGSAVRSVVLEIYEDNSLGILFRDHCRARWAEALMLNSR